MKNAIHYAGIDFLLGRDDVSPELLADLVDCGKPGPADEAVAYVRRVYDITGDEADCAAYLKGYGAWTEEELLDHDENLNRLIWLTGGALAEDEDAYFSIY